MMSETNEESAARGAAGAANATGAANSGRAVNLTGAKLANQYLLFSLGQESYALPVAQVREVLESASITRLPTTTKYLKGIINLRGSVVPVLDLARRLGQAAAGPEGLRNVIVLERKAEGATRLLGALADSVQAVVEVESRSLEPPPKLGGLGASSLVSAIARLGEGFFIVLDTEELFAGELEVPALERGRRAE